MNEKILQIVWLWLHEKSHELSGLVYEEEGNVVGFAHYRRMPRPLSGKDIGFFLTIFLFNLSIEVKKLVKKYLMS